MIEFISKSILKGHRILWCPEQLRIVRVVICCLCLCACRPEKEGEIRIGFIAHMDSKGTLSGKSLLDAAATGCQGNN